MENNINVLLTAPVIPKSLFTRYNRLSNRLYNRYDNRLDVCLHDTARAGCPTGCTIEQPSTGLTTGCIV